MKLPKRPPTEGVVRVALVRPARALTVYVLMAMQLATLVLLAVMFVLLYHRTMAVCEPLRQGQQLVHTATTPAGVGFANTFRHSADRLGCAR